MYPDYSEVLQDLLGEFQAALRYFAWLTNNLTCSQMIFWQRKWQPDKNWIGSVILLSHSLPEASKAVSSFYKDSSF